MTTPKVGHPIGSLADEAGQLIDAVAAKLTSLKAAAGEPVIATEESEAVSGPAHTCLGWCPICRGADLLRGDRPEMSEKLLDTALLLLTALRSLIPEQPPAAADFQTTDPIDRAGVERIDIR